MNVTVPRSVDSPDGLLKLDYRPSQTHSFTLEANALHRRTPDGAETEAVASNGGLLGYNANQDEETRYGKASWTSVLGGHAINELRGGWFKDRISDYPDSSLLPSTGLVDVSVAGANIGANPAYPSVLSEQRFELVDNLTLTGGSHSLKVGVDFSKTEDWLDQLYSRNGSYTYPSLTAFADDFSGPVINLRNYTNFAQTFGNPIVDLHPKVISAYAQDTWKATRRLTVIAGVRFEKALLPQPTDSNATYFQTTSIPSPNTDFAPRIGLAYLVNDRTVVRAGLGFYYEPFPGQLLDALFTGNGVYQTNALVNAPQTGSPVFPRLIPSAAAIPSGSENVIYPTNKFRNPYTEQGTVSVERRLTGDTTLTVSYIDNRGLKLWSAYDSNLDPATVTKTYTIDNASGGAAGTYSTLIWTAKNDEGHAHVYDVNNEGMSRYRGLAIQLRRQMSHGLTVQASYTWSHAIDDISGSPLIGFVPATTSVGDYRADQGNSALDQRNRAVVSWTWQPTVTSNDSLVARYLLNGWQVSSITTMASSLGETPIVLVNNQQFNGASMAYTNSIDGSGGWARAPFLPVNSLLTGPEYNVDARLTRTLPFTERVKGMLTFEAFNVFNTQYNTSVNTIAYTATAGALKPVAGLGLGNAAYGFPSGANARACQVSFRIVF